jgi:hypothetical protein
MLEEIEREEGSGGCESSHKKQRRLANHEPSTESSSSKVQIVYLIQGKIKFAKLRTGCRLCVLRLTEQYHGKARKGTIRDGIFFDDLSEHLSFQIIFTEQIFSQKFSSQIKKFPDMYHRTTLGSLLEVVLPDIEVEIEPPIAISEICTELERILKTDTRPVIGEADYSPDWNIYSDPDSRLSVRPSTDNQLRLIQKVTSRFLYGKLWEECRLVSKWRYPKYENNPNNIIFMSCTLRQYFEGLNSTQGIPLFYLLYISHDPVPISSLIDGKPCLVYGTKVKVVFKDEEAMNVISVEFATHLVLSSTEIEIILYFPSPDEFKTFVTLNAEIKIGQWRAYDGLLS